jgi:hypothetical protein
LAAVLSDRVPPDTLTGPVLLIAPPLPVLTAFRIMPFSQIIDVEGTSEDVVLKTELAVKEIELEPQYDLSGDVRFLAVNMAVDGFFFVYLCGGADSIHPEENIIRLGKSKVDEWLENHK